MAFHARIGNGIVPAVIAALSLLASCNSLTEVVEVSQTKIVAHFKQQGLYERNNIPEDTNPNSIKGYYDIVKGAYRYIVNEDRDGRDELPEINAGDSIAFYFDARIFTSSYDNAPTYYTNIASQIEYISNNNPQFDTRGWPTDLLKIKAGSDPGLLRSIQNALISCRPGDVVRIYLPPNVAYGTKGDGIVPAKSTLVWEITNLVIVEPEDPELREASAAARTAITAHLAGSGIYERGNVPEEVPPASVNGYYDIIQGAYRYITNEDREGRDEQAGINAADSVAFHFDARIFTNSFDTAHTYLTNIESRIDEIAAGTPGFGEGWPTDPLKIKVGDDPKILKSIQNALPTCKPGDVVRIFLPPDVAYGNKPSGDVPALSTLAFSLTGIEIIEPE